MPLIVLQYGRPGAVYYYIMSAKMWYEVIRGEEGYSAQSSQWKAVGQKAEQRDAVGCSGLYEKVHVIIRGDRKTLGRPLCLGAAGQNTAEVSVSYLMRSSQHLNVSCRNMQYINYCQTTCFIFTQCCLKPRKKIFFFKLLSVTLST